MDTAKPATPPSVDSTVRGPTAPMDSRTTAMCLVAAFIVGGLLASVVAWWVLVLIGIVVGAVALYAINRYSGSRGV
jgi:hypothetical protein